MKVIAQANISDASIKPIKMAIILKTISKFLFKLNILSPQNVNIKSFFSIDAIEEATVSDAQIKQIEKASIHDTNGKF